MEIWMWFLFFPQTGLKCCRNDTNNNQQSEKSSVELKNHKNIKSYTYKHWFHGIHNVLLFIVQQSQKIQLRELKLEESSTTQGKKKKRTVTQKDN